MSLATFRAVPKEGHKCILNPGAAFTSIIAPPFFLIGDERVGATTSIPQMSNPIIRATRSNNRTLEGCTFSVTSVAVPPVLKLAVGFK